MYIKYLKLIFLIIFEIAFLSSCVSRKDIVYFHKESAKSSFKNTNSKTLKLKPNDRLMISVSAQEQSAANPFNLPIVSFTDPSKGTAISNTQTFQTYLINSDGEINFPVIGNVKAAESTLSNLKNIITTKVSRYVKDAIVTVELVNFEVSVLGEVNQPNTFSIDDPYITLPKAIGLAGDLTIYGRRDNILVIREEEDGTVTRNYLDITDPAFIESPYYFLKQNDIVYVEPNNAQRQGANFNRNSTIYLSAASLLVSVISLFVLFAQ